MKTQVFFPIRLLALCCKVINSAAQTVTIKLYVLFVLLFFTGARSFSQTLSSGIQSLIPPAPNAAAIAKYTETPVSYYTGLPQISIPIYQVTDGDISIPVSINYHSGGIKVDEVASSVGLGWSLSAGGTITRATRGLADDNIPIDETKLNKYFNGQMAAQEEIDYLRGVYNGEVNTEYDMYYLSVGNLNCKFLITNTGKFLTLPRNNKINIEYNVSGYWWIITDTNGIKYKFSSKETTTSTNFTKVDNNGENDAGFFTGTSSYYLDEIEDTKGNKVNFSYVASTSSLN
jgi:hypothetical protein